MKAPWRKWSDADREQLRELRGQGLSVPAIAKQIGRTYGSVNQQALKLGIVAAEKKAAPPGFAEYAKGKRRADIKRHFKIGDETMRRWCKATGLGDQYVRLSTPAPDGFAEVAPTVTIFRCATIYGVGYRTAERWYTEAGITPAMRPTPAAPAPRPHRHPGRS